MKNILKKVLIIMLFCAKTASASSVPIFSPRLFYKQHKTPCNIVAVILLVAAVVYIKKLLTRKDNFPNKLTVYHVNPPSQPALVDRLEDQTQLIKDQQRRLESQVQALRHETQQAAKQANYACYDADAAMINSELIHANLQRAQREQEDRLAQLKREAHLANLQAQEARQTARYKEECRRAAEEQARLERDRRREAEEKARKEQAARREVEEKSIEQERYKALIEERNILARKAIEKAREEKANAALFSELPFAQTEGKHPKLSKQEKKERRQEKKAEAKAKARDEKATADLFNELPGSDLFD